MPPLTMSYTAETETYLDIYSPTPPASGAGCGPAWNATLCKQWSETYNAYFLTQLDNGRGWSETDTWANAHNNTHGVPSGQTKEDPLVCNSEMTTAPCYLADDENWSRIVLTKRQASVLCVTASGGGCGSIGSQTLTSTWSYLYTLTDLSAVQCVSTSQYPYSCPVGMYWGDINDGDYLDYYNAVFMGFASATVTDPDGSIHFGEFFTTLGYGLWSTSVIGCASYSGVCDPSPWTNPNNALHGHLYEELDYSKSWALQRERTTLYAVTCPPTGVAASPNGIYTGQLSAALDQRGNPITDCEITTTQDNVYLADGGSTSTAPHLTTGYTYSRDSAGHLSQVNTTPTSNDGGALGSPTTSVQVTENVWNDNVAVTSTSASGTYLLAVPAYTMIEPSGGSVRLACVLRGFDGHAYTIGAYSGLTKGQETTEDHYTTQCGTPANGWTYTGKAETTATYDAFGNLLTTDDADANAGVSGHTGCTNGSTQTLYTACAGFDPNFGTLLIWTKDALNQISHENYPLTTSQWGTTNGWGQWLPSQTDANGQTTSFAYDPLGRLVSTTLPAETSGDTSSQDAYPVTCAATGAQEPCVALAATRRLDGLQVGDTVTSATYYDGWGRPVETVTPAPGGSGGTCQFTVSYTLYNPQGQASFTSQPYFTTASCPGGTNPPPYFEPDTTQAGASVTYDALGRTLTTTDALGATTTTSYAQAQPQGANVSDTAYYEQTTVVDTNGHKSAVLTDALGRETYAEAFTGNGGSVPYALYATTASVYDLLGDVVTVTGPNAGAAGLATSAQMTATYDVSGRQTGITDADLGTGWAYTYDQNGNVVQSVDPRGAAGTVYLGYDGLNRQLWRNTTNSQTGAYASYSYDSTAGGNHGVGRLTGETFNTGASLGAGSYAYSYDARGQVTGTTTVLDGGTYPLGFGYNDAGMPTTTTYSDGEVATLGYTPEGWLTSLATTPSGGSATNLITGLGYAGAAGAAMQPTAASVANGTYSFTASYDGDLRNTDEKLATGGGTTVYEQTHGYDAIGNVTSANTTLSAGTDNQSFCYDDEDRLVWASAATGVGPCGATNTAGTLAAVYAQSYQYDALDRMTTGPAGTFTYGPGMQAGSGAAPLHGVTALGSASYAYDAAGDRTNAGATTGDVYDTERRLVRWTAGGVAGTEAYDGEGQRVAHQTTSGVTTTTTYYVGGVEEVDAASGTITKYYPAPEGLPQGVRVGTTLSYLVRDGLGSVSAALDGSGSVTATALYAPYGQVRYSTGTMPTAKGYTGQRADAASGLDYYGARYYDPATDQFASADTVADGLNRFAYVGESPEARTDPTGQDWFGQLVSDAQSVWSTVTDPQMYFNATTVLETMGAVVLQAVPQAMLEIDQDHALGVGARGLNNAGKRLLSKASFLDKPATLKKLLANRSYQSKSYKAGSGGMRQADTAAAEAAGEIGEGAMLKSWARWGGGAMLAVGAVVDFGVTYNDYVSSHPDDPNAGIKGAGFGLLHAGLSTGGAILGGAIGSAIGATIGMFIPVPGLDIAAAILLAGVGSATGDAVAQQIQNGVDDGSFQQAWNDPSGAALNVGNGVTNGLLNLGGAVYNGGQAIWSAL
jgi:RHS repeat-associated protein